ASLLALLGFPVIFEPPFSLPQLAWGWSAVYAVFVVFCATTAWMSARGATTDAAADRAIAADAAEAQAPSWATQVTWLVLAAMGSIMLLAVTNHVTQNISSVPFLWVLPLSLYLLTFILCFDHPRWYVRPLVVALVVVVAPLMAAKIASFSIDLSGFAAAVLPLPCGTELTQFP